MSIHTPEERAYHDQCADAHSMMDLMDAFGVWAETGYPDKETRGAVSLGYLDGMSAMLTLISNIGADEPPIIRASTIGDFIEALEHERLIIIEAAKRCNIRL